MRKNHLSEKVVSLFVLLGIFLCTNSPLQAQKTQNPNDIERAVAGIMKQVGNGIMTQKSISKEDVITFMNHYNELVVAEKSNLFNEIKTGEVNEANTSLCVSNLVTKYARIYDKYKMLPLEEQRFNGTRQVDNDPNGDITWPGVCNPACSNMDFSSGTLASWMTCYSNVNTATTSGPFTIAAPTCSGILTGTTASSVYPTTNLPQVQIVTAASGNDPVCGAFIPQLCPWGGSYSVEVGDYNNPNYGVGILEQQFSVTASDCFLTYSYAALLENPSGHGHYGQPYMSIYLYDQNGNVIPSCGANFVESGDSAAKHGFKGFYYAADGDTVYCKPWTKAFVSLKQYIGQCVTIKVLTADCYAGGHFGYAYFSAQCGSSFITTSSPATCSGPITLTAPGGAASYQWSGPCISGAANTQSITATCAGKYSVIIKSSINSSCTDTLDTLIIAGTKPTAGFSSTNACLGTPILFTNTSTGGSNFSWNFGDGSGTSSAPSPQYTYANAGTYTVTLTASNGTCDSSISQTVVVSPLPTITITSSPSNDSVCNGSSITLSGVGGVSYNWSGGITNGQAFVPASTTKYVVTGIGSNGCSNTDTVTAFVVRPNITITSSPANEIVCKGNSITLLASGAMSYSWSGGISNGVAFIPATSAQYIVTATDKQGCQNTDTANVKIDVPVITITSLPRNDTVCAGGAITLSGNGGVSYAWSGGVTNGVAFSPSVTAKYIVTGTDSNNCMNKDSVTVIAGSGSLPVITAASLPANDSICPGQSVILSGNGGAYYSWSGGVTNGVAFSPVSSGKYVVTGTNASGCSNTDTVNVVVKTLPVINLTGQNLIPPGATDTITASGGITYAWSTGGTYDSIIVTPTIKTTYTVTVNGVDGCSDTASFTVSIMNVTGIGEQSNENTAVVYPNPAEEVLNLEFNSNSNNTDVVIKINNVLGQQIGYLESKVSGHTIVPVNISALATGIYFIRVETGSYVQVLKFIKK